MVYVVGNVAGYHEAADIMHYISLINPGYCLCAGLTNLYVNHVIRNTCKASDLSVIICQILDVSYAEVPFEFFSPGIGYILVYLFIEGIVYFTLTLLADHYQQIKQYFQRKKGLTTQKLHENAITASQLQNRRLSTRADDELATNRLGVPAAVYPGSQVWSIASQEPRIRTVHVKKDNSVKEEKLLVDSLFQKSQFDGYNVVVGRLTKHYNSSFMDRIMTAWRFQPLRQPAVNNMSMLLEETQCFGLLGYNGAGKSTTFKMLTGEISASSGTAVIAGYDVRTHLRQVQKNIGYCPQFDALIERLTGRELLTMFARIKGVSERDISRVVQSHIDTLGLAKHADKQCRKYSGGNRRKLSTGIALLGNPSVIFLDEPTSGMDIKTRQNFIATLNRIMQEERKTIILSSHSISECESLCNKIGIMIGGEFRCIGSTEKLKNLYGERETKVTIRVEHCTYEDLPPYNPLFDDSLIQSETMRSSFLISNSMNQRRSSVTSLMRPPSVYNRVRNVGRLLSISSAINVEEDEPLDEEDDDVCNNPYLQEVCDRMKQHFHKKMDIKKISIENDEVTYKLSRKTVPLSDIFKFMEQLKADQSLHVINYSVNQSTLDQV
jgi:ATP-binding cassette subfamily A (ABC1) protein 3